jgi:hypothetical protein
MRFWKMMTGIFLLIAGVNTAWAQSRIEAGDYKRYFPDQTCDRTAFELATRGYNILRDQDVLRESRYLTIIDFTKPSNVPRLFVLDVKKGELALQSIVSHGVGSDPDSTTIPYRFSNVDGSHATSVGFYLTGKTYFNFRPADSLGLCLFGLDNGYNDAAAAREIVVHYGATERKGKVYVTDTGAGRSYGCPALPLSTNTRFIKMVEGGSLMFVYSDKVTGYEERSSVLRQSLKWPLRQRGPDPNFCSCDVAPDRVRFDAVRR